MFDKITFITESILQHYTYELYWFNKCSVFLDVTVSVIFNEVNSNNCDWSFRNCIYRKLHLCNNRVPTETGK